MRVLCGQMGSNIIFLIVIAVALSSWIQYRQPNPYMDELFHVPQAQNFCLAIKTLTSPSYDSAITTPPGLYIPNALLSAIVPFSFICSTRILRLLNALLIIPIFVTITDILHLLQLRNSNRPNLTIVNLISLCITFIPVSFFFIFLYYTDTPSTLYILAAWNLSLKERPIPSAISATLASFTRQTNIVWHFFIILDSFVYRSRHNLTNLSLHTLTRNGVKAILPHAPSIMLYMIFLAYNGGVALGDRENHKETFHHVTIAYLSLFHTLFHLPLQFALNPSKILSVVSTCFRNHSVQATFVASCAVSAYLVLATADYVHPFVLSDNRHITFYLYRRWLGRSSKHRLILVPLYAYASTSIHVELLQLQSQYIIYEMIVDILTILCSCAVLLPNPLLEPRYFVVPNLFLTIRRIARAEVSGGSSKRLLLVGVLFLSASIALIFVFAELPFSRPPDSHMPQDKSPGRFML